MACLDQFLVHTGGQRVQCARCSLDMSWKKYRPIYTVYFAKNNKTLNAMYYQSLEEKQTEATGHTIMIENRSVSTEGRKHELAVDRGTRHYV
nr:hypothetical transcript [Hymenolepis microstoma]